MHCVRRLCCSNNNKQLFACFEKYTLRDFPLFQNLKLKLNRLALVRFRGLAMYGAATVVGFALDHVVFDFYLVVM